MTPQNRITHIEFEYPVEVKDGENTIVIIFDSVIYTLSITPGIYFLTSNSMKPKSFVPDVSYNLYEELSNVIGDATDGSSRGPGVVDMKNALVPRLRTSGPVAEILGWQFSDPDFTLNPALLGYHPDRTDDDFLFGVTEIAAPYSPLGRWLLFTKFSEDILASSKQWIQEHRVSEVTTNFLSDLGNGQSQSTYAPTLKADFHMRNIPAPMVWEYAGDRVEAWRRAFSATVATDFDGNPNYAVEHLWRALNHSQSIPETLFKGIILEEEFTTVPFNPYEKANHISVKIFYQGLNPDNSNVQRMRGWVTDRRIIGNFWEMIDDETRVDGEMYSIRLPMNLTPYYEEE